MNWQNPPPHSATYFAEANIKLVWRELNCRYGFPLEPWKKRFANYCDQSQIKDRIAGFYKFGDEIINPVMNEILCRSSSYPTFQEFVGDVLRKGWI
jgi:hypothetical protein